MADRWSHEFAGSVREWCDAVGPLAVDALVYAGLVKKEEFDRASGIVAEELFARLCLLDYPPVPEALGRAPDTEPV